MTRFKTYQMTHGFTTIDSQTEAAPEGCIAGPLVASLTYY